MNIRDREEGNVTIVEPSGDLDDKNVRQFDQKIAELLQANRRRFVIDLREIDHVSAAGLRSLLTLSKRLNDGHLVLCTLNDRVREAFEIAGFAEIFLIADSPQEAIRLLQPENRRASAIARLTAKLLGIGERGSEVGVPPPEISDIADIAAAILIAPEESPGRSSPASDQLPELPESNEPPSAPTREPGAGFAETRRRIRRWIGGLRS